MLLRLAPYFCITLFGDASSSLPLFQPVLSLPPSTTWIEAIDGDACVCVCGMWVCL